jgi:hypothetical protein
MNAMVPVAQSNAELYRASTDAAGLCRDVVLKTAMEIQGRKYVKVEGWQAIAIAHGCAASAKDVEAVDGGVRATGEVRRMADGAVIATAEGFIGEDEPVWFGGTTTDRWGKTKTTPKRPDYAIRAMAQTRAISRACRSAFAHVVVLMDAELSTTPAEEVPDGGFSDEPRNVTPAASGAKAQTGLTLQERADAFEQKLRACKIQPDLQGACHNTEALRADLDRSDPERLVELEALVEKLGAELPAQLPAKADADEVFA